VSAGQPDEKINLTSDRVRLPSNTAWFPTQQNRALTKLKFPFLCFNYAYRLSRQNIPAIPTLGTENTTASFLKKTQERMEGKKGAMLRLID
jgi:hypothetical protein